MALTKASVVLWTSNLSKSLLLYVFIVSTDLCIFFEISLVVYPCADKRRTCFSSFERMGISVLCHECSKNEYSKHSASL
jgi:hypothetical protein